jgi:uncharacterized protein (TIGR00369 family)
MAPYGGRVTFEAARFPLQDHLGMTVGSAAPGVGVAAVDVTPALHNPNGVVHGAVLFAMVDTAMGAATMSSLDEGLACASIEVHLRFLRAVSSGRLTAESTVIKGGRRIVQLDSRVTDDTGQLVASASGSFAVISAR